MVTVAIIEDCTIISAIYKHILKKIKTITETNSFETCQEYIDNRLNKKIFDDILLVDHGNVAMSGIDLIKYMDENKLIKDHIKLYIITGYNKEFIKKRLGHLYNKYNIKYVEKPVTPNTFINIFTKNTSTNSEFDSD